jgi:hypothetical protein
MQPNLLCSPHPYLMRGGPRSQRHEPFMAPEFKDGAIPASAAPVQ